MWNNLENLENNFENLENNLKRILGKAQQPEVKQPETQLCGARLLSLAESSPNPRQVLTESSPNPRQMPNPYIALN